ncbi:MAG: acyl transferase [Planctomycetota bacterium]
MKYNTIFRSFSDLIHQKVVKGTEINFLPISFFKNFEIKTGVWETETIFTSSGTTKEGFSSHHIRSLDLYLQNTKEIFETHFGSPEDICFLCLLPSYLELQGSSLIAMCKFLVDTSHDSRSAFYLNEYDRLITTMQALSRENKKTFLIGVTYALLDLLELNGFRAWDKLTIIKTGGMKGRRKEMSSDLVDSIMMKNLEIKTIKGEYGMTECLSQLYSLGCNFYKFNSRMKIILTELSDPFEQVQNGRPGRINIVDLANVDSCGFISTDDIGIINEEGQISILGRIDHSDLRGCNMLI